MTVGAFRGSATYGFFAMGGFIASVCVLLPWRVCGVFSGAHSGFLPRCGSSVRSSCPVVLLLRLRVILPLSTPSFVVLDSPRGGVFLRRLQEAWLPRSGLLSRVARALTGCLRTPVVSSPVAARACIFLSRADLLFLRRQTARSCRCGDPRRPWQCCFSRQMLTLLARVCGYFVAGVGLVA